METGVENGMETAPERDLAAVSGVARPQGPPLLSVKLLGPMTVARPTSPAVLPSSRKARGLLAYLIMARRPLHRSRLCEIFWDGPNDPRSELRWCLTKIRAVLDDTDCKRVRADKDYISIDVSTLNVDALRIEQHAEAALAGSDVQVLERLAASIDGEFLDGLLAERIPLFESWLVAQRERYGTWHARILGRMSELLPLGSEQRIAILRKRIDLHPDDLSGHRDLLTAFAASGRIAEGDAHLGLARKLLRHDGVNHASLDKTWQMLRQQVLHPEPNQAGEGQHPSTVAGTGTEPRSIAPPTLPGLQSGGVSTGNLPPQLTSYIGRDLEETEVRSRLSLHRLVTLTGPGGAGKTRLAVEIGRTMRGETPDGVWMVELAPVLDPQIVADVVCSSIGVSVADGRTAVDSAAAYLRHKKVLLILDNCEHLLDPVASLTLALLLNCPMLSILATSRERLGVVGERTYQVPGLALPPQSGPTTAEAARQHDAVRLFEERAKVAVQGFALSDANAEAVTNICIQLDGIPMAIELVVPQLRMIQPHGLAARLRDRVLLVMQGERSTLPRHRTLGALFDWSYNLLSEPEQALFRRLSVFTGGWSLEAAMSVTADDPVDPDTVFELLSRLVDKSLVFADLRGPVPRYGYLETARQYALVKHNDTGDDRRRRLAAYMIRLFSASDETWSTTPTEQWLAMYEPDIDNLRASLDWAFGPDGDVTLGIELCCYSLRIWDDLALLSERERWFGMAFDRRDAQTPARILARLCLGRLSNSAHGDRNNFDLAVQASEYFREAGERQEVGDALAKAGAALQSPDTTALAMPYLENALDVLRPAGPSKPLASCLRSLAIAHYFIHDFAGARPFLRQSEAVAKAVGDLRGAAAVQLAAAELAFAEGSTEEAIDITNAMLSGGKCNRRQKVLGLTNLAAYLLAADRIEEARLNARSALHEAIALDWRAAIVRLVEHLALVAALTEQTATAARMFGYSVAFYETGAASREHTELATYDRLSALVSSAIPPPGLQRLMAEGADWTGEQAAQNAVAAVGFET